MDVQGKYVQPQVPALPEVGNADFLVQSATSRIEISLGATIPKAGQHGIDKLGR